MKMDLHMHTRISDGTDSPEELLQVVRSSGISLFSVTDHDALSGNRILWNLLKPDDPSFICGIEFSCQDEQGKYHILGYGFDPEGLSIRATVDRGQAFRTETLRKRLQLLEQMFQISFPENEIQKLMELDNPGKPHIGNLMVQYGFAGSLKEAFASYLQLLPDQQDYIRPEDAVQGILESGGVPVLAHPFFGDGSDRFTRETLEERLDRLISFGLKGVEAFYSGFSEDLIRQTLQSAAQRNLYITAGSDYHGKNKTIPPGLTGLDEDQDPPEGLKRFLRDVQKLPGWRGHDQINS